MRVTFWICVFLMFFAISSDSKAFNEVDVVPSPPTCVVEYNDWLHCTLPIDQLQFLNLPYNCRITYIDDYKFDLWCTTGEVVEPKIIKSNPAPLPSSTVKVTPNTKPKAKKIKKKKKRKKHVKR